MSWDWIVLWAWLAGWALSVLPIARWIRRSFGDEDGVDLFFTSAIAVVAGMLWPLVIGTAFVYAKLRAEQRDPDKLP